MNLSGPIVFLLFLLMYPCTWAQNRMMGLVSDEQNIPVASAHVHVSETNFQTVTDGEGLFVFDPAGYEEIHITVTALGFETQTVLWTQNSPDPLPIKLANASINLNPAVVTGKGSGRPNITPVVFAHQVNAQTLRRAAAFSMAEGLPFSPSVRVENNCQSCGMTGIRINGLDGRYSRMLINGRPVLGAMAGVYGLEHFPASWIENLEISRGSRQPFWGGGGAISGTVNLITHQPSCSRTEFSANGGLFSNGESEWNGSGIIARTLNDGKQGLQVAYSGRYRSALDLNGDEISDIPRLHNQTLITEWKNNLRQNRILNLRTYYLFEERRGGNYFNRPFHLTDITEALTHHSAGIDLTFSASPSSSCTAHSIFFSFFFTRRKSYYGSGGKAAYEYLAENQVWKYGPQTAADTAALEKYERALNAYGKSFEVPFTAGYNATSRLTNKLILEWGAELLGNILRDAMPFYGRSLAENTINGGAYIRAIYSPLKRITLTAGFRGDAHLMQSRMTTGHAAGKGTRWFFTPLPRINTRIDFGRGINMQVGYGRGFRLPRIGSEELHVSLVGGDVLLVVQAPGLGPEVSDAADMDIGWEKKIGEHYLQIKSDVFFTRIRNMFIMSGQTQTGDFALIEKRNGGNANVWGITAVLEWKWKNWVNLDLGFTRQWGLFDYPQIIWENDEAGLLAHPELVHTKTNKLLRNPNWYGYAILAVTPGKWEFSVSGLFTGNMYVPYVSGPILFSDNESAAMSQYTEIKYTPSFWDVGIRISRQFRIAAKCSLFPELGVQNLFNSFQRDLGTGVTRDPGYQYGPLRPRFFYAGFRVSL